MKANSVIGNPPEEIRPEFENCISDGFIDIDSHFSIHETKSGDFTKYLI